MAKPKYSKSFRMKLEKVRAAREAREAEAKEAEDERPLDTFRTLWDEFLQTGGKHGRAAMMFRRAPLPGERPFRFCSDIIINPRELELPDLIEIPPPWKHDDDTDASE